MKTQAKKTSRFTLIEIMAVIAVIAILAGLTVGTANIVMRKAADSRTESTIKTVEIALERFKTSQGFYPPGTTTANLSTYAATNGPAAFYVYVGSSTTNWQAQLAKLFDQKFINSNTMPSSDANYRYVVDGRGNPLVYQNPGYFNKGKYDLGSVGPDLKYGDKSSSGRTSSGDSEITGPGSIHAVNYSEFGKGDDITNFKNNEAL